MATLVDTFARALSPHGLNLVGVAVADAHDAGLDPSRTLAAIAPGTRSALVIGNGGGAFWAAFRARCAADPTLAAAADPLDAFTRAVITDAVTPLASRGARLVFPFEFPAVPLSFVRLAECAGLGRRSLVGVLVHPEYGPWMALRAALLVPDVLEAPRPAEGFDPCPRCVERSCVAACPAGAVGGAGWDIPRCAAHRGRPDDPCAARCHARFDCVLGRSHRYPADALAYHQARARPLLVENAR